ncbi:MAG TPA: DinB family protein [Gemmatimonadaceae bacterium]|nr:DinB family protein [Gemmatimonadaceae bacterium]
MQTGTDRRVTIIEEELAKSRRAFDVELDAAPTDRLLRAPNGEWTPAQIVWHVAKVERAVARLIERLDAGIAPMETVPPGPRPDSITRMLDAFNILDRSHKLVAAAEVTPPPKVDFEAERARLIDGRAQLTAAIRKAGPRLSLMRYEHMFFGMLDGWQWALFPARHEERHLLQLREVIRR